jgi:hypothetical protein
MYGMRNKSGNAFVNKAVQELQFLNNFLKIAFLQGFNPKKCWTCEGTLFWLNPNEGVPEQVQY